MLSQKVIRHARTTVNHRSTGFTSFWLSMNIPCWTPLIFTHIFSEMLSANAARRYRERLRFAPAPQPQRAQKCQCESRRTETTINASRPSRWTQAYMKASYLTMAPLISVARCQPPCHQPSW